MGHARTRKQGQELKEEKEEEPAHAQRRMLQPGEAAVGHKEAMKKLSVLLGPEVVGMINSRPVKVPLKEFAFLTNETVASVTKPEALNSLNLADIYSKRQDDFTEPKQLVVSYYDTHSKERVRRDTSGPAGVVSQVAVSMSGVEVNPDVGSMFPYKNYLEMLLMVDREAKTSVGEQRGYYQDSTDGVGTTDPTTAATKPNLGLINRHALTKNGQSLIVKGNIGLDFFDAVNKHIINGINMYLTFYQSMDAFRLLAKTSDTRYKLVIESMYITVSYIKLRPEVLIRHSELLASGKHAMYPYVRTYMRNHVIPAGVNSFSISQVLADRIPSLLVVGLVESEAYAGSLTKSPFNFEHFDLNYISLQVGSHSVPGRPMEPDFDNNKFSEEYDSFLSVTRGQGSTFSKKDFATGNSLFCFSVQNHLNIHEGVFPIIRKANTRLEMRFKKNLTNSVVAVLYMLTPGLYTVSESRMVTVEY